MAERTFFKIFEEKMAMLRPSEAHKDQDWDLLQSRLDAVLPSQKDKRRFLLPLLLFALLGSNLAWWMSVRDAAATPPQVTPQAALPTASDKVTQPVAPVLQKIVHDTVWRTVYVQKTDGMKGPSSTDKQPAVSKSASPREAKAILSIQRSSNSNVFPVETTIEKGEEPEQIVVASTARRGLQPLDAMSKPTQQVSVPSLRPKAPIHHIFTTPAVEPVIRHSRFSVGTYGGLLRAVSDGLSKQNGNVYGIRGRMALTRHIGLTASYSVGNLQYTAAVQEAILGNPVVPMPTSPEYKMVDMYVREQRLQHLNLGLQYDFFTQFHGIKPFVGLYWNNQVLSPYSVTCDIKYLPTQKVEAMNYDVTGHIRTGNNLGLRTGFEFPLSSRLALGVEASYQRAWNKANKVNPDIFGLQAGLSWAW
jgi:hypothetical protein